MKKILIRVFAIAVLVALGYGGYRFVQQLPRNQREVATTVVKRGDVTVRTYARGELKAVRQMTLTAPNLFGTVQVTRLAPLGAFAHEGDLIVEFDDAEVLSRLEEKQLELDQNDEKIRKSEADLAIRNNQDEVELLRARYTVRRAELEVQRNELLSEIDARKNTLNLDEAQKRLEKLKSDIQSRRAQAEAELAVLRETRNKARLELEREKQRLSRVKLLAPMTGLVAIRQARTFFFFAGTQMPDIREGDELRPGMPVADILDLSELEVIARVGELDRANLTEGQEVIIRLDALPDKDLTGKIKSLSGTASADVYSNDPAKKFDVTFEIDMKQLLEALGAKPEAIRRILATAEQNRKRAPAASSSGAGAMMAMMGGGRPGGSSGGSRGGFSGAPGGAGRGGAPGASGGAAPGGRTQRTSGGRQRTNVDPSRIISRLPDVEKKKAQKILDKELDGKKWADLGDKKKQEIFGKIRPILRQAFRRGGASPAPGGSRSRTSQFTKAQFANAKLPPPPEQDSQLDVLMRPGLLADVEIIVERIPNAIHIPVYALFEKDNKPMVYVKRGKRFEERFVKPLKRSESTMVIAEGLEPGEIVALADPFQKPGGQKGAKPAEGEGGAGNPMGGFGGGSRSKGSGGGRRGR